MPDETEDTTTEDATATGSAETQEVEGTESAATEADSRSDVDEGIESLPESWQTKIRQYRREAQTKYVKAETEKRAVEAAEEARRATAAEAEQRLTEQLAAKDKEWRDRAAKALGLVEDEPELTPEQVAERITAERDQARKDAEARGSELLELLREVAVQDAAAMHDANPGRLTDSRAFMAKVAQIDATDKAAFRVAVADLVKAEVEADPDLKATRKPTPPAASGGTTVAGTAPKGIDDMSVEELIRAGYTKRR